MKAEVFSCIACGAPLAVSESQRINQCRYCKSKFYVQTPEPPAMVLAAAIDEADARRIVEEKMRHREISPYFLQNAVSVKCTLYFIPFFEVRGVKTGTVIHAPGKAPEFSYQTYYYLEKANDLKELGNFVFDAALVEEALLKSKHTEFDPVGMRKQGVVLPPKNTSLLISKAQYGSMDDVENHHRLVYFPIWEVSRIYQGILFKSFISAVDGRVLEIQALRSQSRKLLFSTFGLFCFAILIGRGLYFGKNVLLPLLLIAFPTAIILFPYLWEVFAFQEMVEISGGGEVRFQSINYTENSFVKFCSGLMDGVIKFFWQGKENE